MKKEEVEKIVGFAVQCKICGKTKAPRGRSVSPVTACDYCNFECPGYSQLPHPGDLWPGETAEEFGFPCSGPVVGKMLREILCSRGKNEEGVDCSECDYEISCQRRISQILEAGYIHKSQITIDEGEARGIFWDYLHTITIAHTSQPNEPHRQVIFKAEIPELIEALKKADIIKIEEE